MSELRVLIADSQELFADALAIALSRYPDLQVLDEQPSSGVDTLRSAAASEPDVVVLDYWISGMRGPTCAKAILHKSPGVKILVLAWFHSRNDVGLAFQAGARGFLPKTASLRRVTEAVQAVGAGERVVFDGASRLRATTANTSPAGSDDVMERLLSLSPREIEILGLLAFAPVEKVASALHLARGTVRNHIFNILKKTEARSQIEAIAMARRNGLIDP